MRLWEIYHAHMPDFLAQAALTPAMQRLTDIGMNCGCEYTGFPPFAGVGRYSRYDHSVGAALIVWHFTHDRTQAMAALLHDIATPAFAHVVDFLRGDHLTQEATEHGTAEFIRASKDICCVCDQYGLPLEAVTDYHRYPIADNDSPKLSADRLEYTLGNAVNFGIITRDRARALYGSLTVADNEDGNPELMFCHAEAALTLAEAALACSTIYVSPADRYAMQRLAKLLQRAITERVLSEADLYLQEHIIIAKLADSPLADEWTQFCSCSELLRRDTPVQDGVWLRVAAKKRYIDPCILGTGRVSSACPAFAAKLHTFLTAPQDEWLSAR